MTLIADAKKRVVLPDAAPGDVFTCEKIRQGMLLRRVCRRQRKKKMTKNEVLAAIRRWKYIPAMSWDELRKLTREPLSMLPLGAGKWQMGDGGIKVANRRRSWTRAWEIDISI